MLEASAYRGPDRRGPAASVAAPSHPLRYAVIVAGVLVVCAVAVRATAMGGRPEEATFAALRDSASGLLVLAGTVLLVNWALTGRAARALDGSALLLAGGAVLVLAGPWGAFMHHGETASLISPGCRLAVLGPALVLLLRSPRVVPVDSTVRPLRTVTTAAAGVLTVLAVEALVRLDGPLDQPVLWTVVMAALAAGWLTAGLQRVVAASASRAATGEALLGWSLVALAAGSVLLAVTFRTSLGWGVAGAALQLIGAAGAAAVAVAWLLLLLGRDSDRQLRLASELADIANILEDEQTVRQQLVHDARNVVMAIRTATLTLERHSDRLEPEVQQRLQDAVGSEFARLQSLLDTRDTP
jgi:hypothetical protein